MHISKTARAWALDTLQKWQQESAFSNLLLHQQLQKSSLDSRDKRLVTELVYGTIQRLNTLDYIIDQLVNKKTLDGWVRQLLQLSLYQFLYLDKIPERAVVHEAVELAKWRGNIGISKFVNGVLRSFLRKQKEFIFSKDATQLKQRSLAYSFPEWIVTSLSDAYGKNTANLVMEACNLPPKVSIRVNTLRADRETFLADWRTSESSAANASKLSEDGVILSGIGNAANLAGFGEGAYTIQDESSMLVASLFDPKPGMHILDACAAPGGKTTHLAEKMKNQGEITALDIHKHKVKLIDSNAKRLGISIISARALDARKLEDQVQYDGVLLDAPCSGLGVIPRKPDIKWRKSAEEVGQLMFIQQQLLESVAAKVKPGGILMYSTCTWTQEENQQQMAHFLANHPEYVPDEEFLTLLPENVKQTAIIGDAWVQILPHHFQSDGFFIAKLRRKSISA
ncbi:16S rRNA (cytosine(967)-C(5))-methyltransferase RsmB [Shimazuella sp. AN120528]|uniref:16S rRNA (cytosine(967)-C(5))-methyltransferase RsmB n=1 Tax=Shimazuella soli TaxID=1892854 RepID=UPI001F0CF217|nr:16S rRNA (cytosine(967)-C(5))-methyltransferase RsmB [Shimazuella soli]MCH5584869.1 16S rRNA (cytosine(967)-C(5))-methyltransferase RsmB [Shimazuella soli]